MIRPDGDTDSPATTRGQWGDNKAEATQGWMPRWAISLIFLAQTRCTRRYLADDRHAIDRA